MRKDALHSRFRCYVYVQHNNLVAVQGQFVLFYLHAVPELLDFLFDYIGHLAKRCQLLKWGFALSLIV